MFDGELGVVWTHVWPVAVALAVITVGWISVSVVARRVIERWTNGETDPAAIPKLPLRSFRVGVVLLGVIVWARLVVPTPAAKLVVDKVASVALVVLFVVMVNGLVDAWLMARSRHSRVLQTSGGVIRTTVRVVVFVVGLLMLLSAVGINVTPVIASLGIGSLAIGLALQKTLENFFAGLLIAADQPVRVGDFVEFDTHSGVVLSIGWRSTRIVTRDRNTLVIPNATLAQANLTNRSTPRELCEFRVPVGVHYSTDLAAARRAIVETATNVIPTAVLEGGFVPFARLTAFGPSSIDFVAVLSAPSWAESFKVRDVFIEQLQLRFAADGIDIPFPIQTLHAPDPIPVTITSST